MNRDISIPATGEPVAVPVGVFKYLAVRSADVAFQLSFDGWIWENAKQNDRWDKSSQNPPFEKVHVKALNGLAAEITLIWDTKPLGAQDTAQSIVLNSSRGCGGAKNALIVPAAKIADGVTNYQYDNAVPVDLTKNGILYIPGTVNGKKRKSITFDNTNAGNAVVIFAPDGSLVYRLKPGDNPVTLETSSDFYVGGNGGDSGKFIYSELFYERSNS